MSYSRIAEGGSALAAQRAVASSSSSVVASELSSSFSAWLSRDRMLGSVFSSLSGGSAETAAFLCSLALSAAHLGGRGFSRFALELTDVGIHREALCKVSKSPQCSTIRTVAFLTTRMTEPSGPPRVVVIAVVRVPGATPGTTTTCHRVQHNYQYSNWQNSLSSSLITHSSRSWNTGKLNNRPALAAVVVATAGLAAVAMARVVARSTLH